MPTINGQFRKKRFSLGDLEEVLREICAPALSTDDNDIEPNTGLIVNLNKCTRLDRRFDLYLEIEGYGEPEVSGRDIELITAKIKAGFAGRFPSHCFGGWVKIGSEKRWFSSYEETKSVAEIEKLNTPIEQLISGKYSDATRLLNKLSESGVRSVGDLVRMSMEDLLDIDGLGSASLAKMRICLQEIGLSLRGE